MPEGKQRRIVRTPCYILILISVIFQLSILILEYFEVAAGWKLFQLVPSLLLASPVYPLLSGPLSLLAGLVLLVNILKHRKSICWWDVVMFLFSVEYLFVYVRMLGSV